MEQLLLGEQSLEAFLPAFQRGRALAHLRRTQAEKLQELENQRRALLSSAEPRLAALYAEHDSMEDEIQKMTEKK